MERITVTIDGNTAGLEKALKSAENRLNSFNTRLTNASRGLTRLMGSMAGFGASVQAVTQANLAAAASLTQMASRANAAAAANNRLAASNRSAARSAGTLNVGVRDVIMGLTSLNTLIYTSSFLFGGIVASTISANAQLEKMTVLMKNVSGGANEAQRNMLGSANMDYLWKMADNAPFKIQALSDSFVKLKASGIDPTKGSLKALVDTVAFFGGDTEQLKRAGVALSQMLSKGKVTAEELRQQLGDAVPNAMKDMAEALDMTIPELDAKMKKGLVLSADAVPKLMKLWQEKYKGGAENMMNTWDGAMARLSNSWTRMIQRVTATDDKNSLFAKIKEQVVAFSTFMNSKQGDDFAGSISRGLGQLVEKIASAIKFLYTYRDTIIMVAEAVAKLWVVGRIAAAFTATRVAIGGLVGTLGTLRSVIPAVITYFSRIAAAQTGTRVVTAAFGVEVRRLAGSLGLFNSAAQISYLRLGALLGVFGLVVGGVAAYVAIQNKLENSTRAQGQATKATTLALEQSKKRLEEVKTANELLIISSEAQRQAAMKEIKARRENSRAIAEETKQKVLNARATYLAATAEAQKQYNAQKARLDQQPGSAMMIGGGPLSGYSARLASQDARNKAEAAKKDLEGLYESWKVQKKTFDEDTVELTKLFNMGPVKPLDAGGKTPKDKLGSTDDKRNEYVTALNKIAELKALNADLEAQHLDPRREEHNEAREAYADNFDDINKRNKAIADGIKSQSVLNSVTSAAQGEVKKLNIENRERQKLNQIEKQDADALARLQGEVNEQTIRANDAVGSLDLTYNSVNAQVARYTESLRVQYKEQLKSPDMAVRAKTETDIMNAGLQKRIELIGDATEKYKRAGEEISDSLLTERELRQKNYDIEVAQVNAMLANITGKTQQEMLLAENLNDYLGKLAQKKQLEDAGPIAAWAKDARDLKTNLRDGMQGIFTGFFDGLMDSQASFAEFANSILKDLGKIIIKAYLAKAILGALGLGGTSFTGSVTPGFIGEGNLGWTSPGIAGGGLGSPIPIPMRHTGGAVNWGGSKKSVDPSVFNFAKRYHTGGFPGLKPNEVPIIAEKGEGVFTADQMKALGSAKGGTVTAPTVNIINQTSTPVNQETAQPRFDGEKYVIDVLLKNANKPGPVRDMLNGRS